MANRVRRITAAQASQLLIQDDSEESDYIDDSDDDEHWEVSVFILIYPKVNTETFGKLKFLSNAVSHTRVTDCEIKNEIQKE